METIAFSRTFYSPYGSSGPRNIEHGLLSFFFRITSSILKFGTCNFTIMERNVKAIFREYFSLLRFDSVKIFKMVSFSHGQGRGPMGFIISNGALLTLELRFVQ